MGNSSADRDQFHTSTLRLEVPIQVDAMQS